MMRKVLMSLYHVGYRVSGVEALKIFNEPVTSLVLLAARDRETKMADRK
jgi:hypothetical protein